jgi:hypothetical protein
MRGGGGGGAHVGDGGYIHIQVGHVHLVGAAPRTASVSHGNCTSLPSTPGAALESGCP